jgi:hypothetical protein
MLLPGASRDKKSALLEKEDTSSDFVVLPTLMAVEIHAGEVIDVVEPLLPEEMTVAIPAVRRLSITGLNEDLSQKTS